MQKKKTSNISLLFRNKVTELFFSMSDLKQSDILNIFQFIYK